MWLAPAWGGGLELRPDLDRIEALSGERDQLWTRLERAGFLSIDEKRAAAGYGPLGDGGGELTAKYNPDRPRVPAGSSDGGQWTSGGGGVLSDADPDNFWQPGALLIQNIPAEPNAPGPVNLQDEDAIYGGHEFKRHVASPNEELLGIVSRDQYRGPGITIARKAQGSFLSTKDANNLVNRVLEANASEVHDIAIGKRATAKFTMRFGFVTGKEAFRADAFSEPTEFWALDERRYVQIVATLRVAIPGRQSELGCRKVGEGTTPPFVDETRLTR